MKSWLGWIPILLFLVTAISFSISYILAVVKGDVNPWWPYIR